MPLPRTTLLRLLPVPLLLLPLAACGDGSQRTAGPAPSATAPAPPSAPTPAAPPPAATPALGAGTPEVVASGLQVPWGLAFLPDGAALVSERESRRILRVTADGTVTPVDVVEGAVARGEGGLLGLAVSPAYATDGLVYAYYTTAEDNRVARFRLGEEPQPVLTGIPAAGNHDGGRITFGPDGLLYVGTGDASDRSTPPDPRSLAGKVLRVTPEGRPAPGNPDPSSPVFTSGHRNVQGLAFDEAGRLWATEFGQDTTDEVNLLEAGRDHGWPEVEGTGGGQRYADPLVTWSPDEASPSGVAVAGGALWVAALRGERLWRVPLDGRGGVGEPAPLLTGEYGRLRTVGTEPGGRALWVLTSNRDGRGDPTGDDDRVLRVPLVPAG